MKSTPQQIRERFDKDVDRFSNLETGQAATIDAPLALDLISQAAAMLNPDAKSLLDVGCGAGNYTLKVLQELADLDVTLIDLSRPMLDRARNRIGQATKGKITPIQGDIREIPLGESQFDVIVAGSVLHHLREDLEWRQVFTQFHAALKPGGSIWIFDLIEHALPVIQDLMWRGYGDHLIRIKDEAYRDQVYAYVQQEDTPRSLVFQLDLLRSVGFQTVEVLHKNNCFAAFGAVK